ncbi:hypothetical protein KO561_08170 [Radiobacillus kanasensis]|uniref:hypothetical protein n=1 Tax=Radiobacillus kanasensis TaxID=2844358 RepID=UPI001E37FF88|nr:hypothetical protein [Radiobacillus kanasensis]UFU00896.1 hypothetical protein KO561_08170 [Radiobacillus kanasensis]
MKKRWLVSTVASAFSLGASYFLRKKENRTMVMDKLKQAKHTLVNENTKNQTSIDKAGMPELDQQENAKMVSEGSQFGVHYYNEVKQQEEKVK